MDRATRHQPRRSSPFGDGFLVFGAMMSESLGGRDEPDPDPVTPEPCLGLMRRLVDWLARRPWMVVSSR